LTVNKSDESFYIIELTGSLFTCELTRKDSKDLYLCYTQSGAPHIHLPYRPDYPNCATLSGRWLGSNLEQARRKQYKVMI